MKKARRLVKKAICCVLVFVIFILGFSFNYANANSSASDLTGQSVFNLISSFNTIEGKDHFMYVVFNEDINFTSINYQVDLRNISSNKELNSEILELVESYGLVLTKAIKLPSNDIEDLENRANRNAQNKMKYHLNDFIKIEMRVPTAENAEYIAKRLEKFAKYVYIGIDMGIIAPPFMTSSVTATNVSVNNTTPNFSELQTYWEENPGFNFQYAWDRGVRGDGISMTDVEHGVDIDHEDLIGRISIIHGGWQPSQDHKTTYHGSASMAIAAALDNGIGIKGIAPEATYKFSSEFCNGGNNYDRVTAVSQAIHNASSGEIVLLEMQACRDSICLGFDPIDNEYKYHNFYLPAEYDPLVWQAVRAGSDAGVIVVAAAGNGDVNLDDTSLPDLVEYKNRGDSGATIVGAGESKVSHNKLYYSTFGERVNVQTWGDWSVMTAGYGQEDASGNNNGEIRDDFGNLIFSTNDYHRFYTRGFSGTSSASALTAAACVAVQSYMKNSYNIVLTPTQMRDLLVRTGNPQGNNGQRIEQVWDLANSLVYTASKLPEMNIGPCVDVKKAIQELDRTYADNWTTGAEIPTPVYSSAVAVHNNKIYTFGGKNDWGISLPFVQCYDVSTNTWTQKGEFSPTANAGACTINNKIYVVGGSANGGHLRGTREYDPSKNTWTDKAYMSSTRHSHGVVALNGKAYAIGGVVNGRVVATVQEYNPSTNTWTSRQSMNTARKDFGVTVANGRIYVVGGEGSSSNRLNSVEEYDPATNTWTTRENMPTARCGLTCSVISGKIYAIGGNYKAGTVIPYSGVVEEYNPTTNTWTKKAGMPTGRSFLLSAEVNNKIYSIGGRFSERWEHNTQYNYPNTEYVNKAATNKVEVYTPSTGTCITKADIPTKVYNSAVAVHNNKIYTFGGKNAGGISLPFVQCYDLSTNTWTQRGELSPIANAGACTINNKIYLVGGSGNGGHLRSTREYDPATNTWTDKAYMSSARHSHGVVALNGKAYAIGGVVNGRVVATVQEYNPSTNTWTSRQSMNTARKDFGVTVANGKIYVIGGEGSSSNRLNSVEEYNPSTNTWTTRENMPTARWGLTCSAINGKIYAMGGNLSSSNQHSHIVEEYDLVTNIWSTRTPMITGRSFSSSATGPNGIYVISGLNWDNGGTLNSVEMFIP